MTTNLGSSLIQENLANVIDSQLDSVLEKTKNQVFDLLSKTMRPEFLNRVDEIILFRPLSQEIIKKVVEIQLQQLREQLQQNSIDLVVTNGPLVDYLAQEGYDPQFGARPLKRLIQRSILNELSKALLADRLDKSKPIQVKITKDKQVQFLN